MRGITTFELTNVKTGEVEVYEDHNMFTNALDSVFNRPPFYFNNTLLAKQNTAEQDAQILAPVYNRALGGLLLFLSQSQKMQITSMHHGIIHLLESLQQMAIQDRMQEEAPGMIETLNQ